MPSPTLSLPKLGVGDQSTFVEAHPETAPPGAMVNIVPHAREDGRRSLGVRRGFSDLFSTALGDGGPIRAMAVLGRAASLTRGFGPARRLIEGAGIVIPPAPPPGGISLLDLDGSIVDRFEDPDYTTADGVCVSPDRFGRLTYHDSGRANRFAMAFNVAKAYGPPVGTVNIGRVHVVVDGVIRASYDVEDCEPGETPEAGAQDIVVKAVELVGPYLLVAASQYLYIFNAGGDGSGGVTDGWEDTTDGYLHRMNMNGWADELQDVRVGVFGSWDDTNGLTFPTTTGTLEYDRVQAMIYTPYRGRNNTGGAVPTNANGEGFDIRAATAMVRLKMPIEGEDFPPADFAALGPANAFFEIGATQDNDDGEACDDFRVGEWTDGKGRVPMAVLPMGMVIGLRDYSPVPGWRYLPPGYQGRMWVAYVNDGYGAGGLEPDGSRGYWNLLETKWRASTTTAGTAEVVRNRFDIASRRPEWNGSGMNSDKPWDETGAVDPDNGLGPESSLTSIAAAALEENVFLAGKFADGKSVRVFPSGWSKNLGTQIPQRGMDSVYVPTAGLYHVAAGGARNNAWDGASGDQAMLWVMDGRTGNILKTWDFGIGKVAKQVGCLRTGRIVVAHTYVS